MRGPPGVRWLPVKTSVARPMRGGQADDDRQRRDAARTVQPAELSGGELSGRSVVPMAC